MRLVIFPWAKAMRNDKQHPKNYPWWPELVTELEAKGHKITQVGAEGEIQLVDDFRKNMPLADLAALLRESDTWISVDTFGQHFAWDLGIRGIVLFGPSDPNIFGHEENINLLKSRAYLRDRQFWLWEQAEFNADAFVPVHEVIAALTTNFT